VTENPISQFLDAVGKLPPTPGLVFRGLADSEPAPTGVGVLAAPVPASADPAVADEGADGPLLVLLTRTARDLTVFSASPDEREVVLLPGTIWSRVLLADLPDVVVLEEIDPAGAPAPSAWPRSREELTEQVRQLLAARSAPVRATEPGKYRGPWPTVPGVPAA